ncbi:MAG: metallophosphoesterase family protein, partial [Nanoarchaeota archaeon]
MVRILAVSDEETLYKKSFTNKKFKNIDILVSCGDLSPSYLEYIVHKTMPTHRIMIHGNHDNIYFPHNYEHKSKGYSDIFKGMHVLNNDFYKIDKKEYNLDENLVIAGFYGANAHGSEPFFLDEKKLNFFAKKMKFKDFFLNYNLPKIILSHCAPNVNNLFKNIDSFHKPSNALGEIYNNFPPNLWFYGHIHPRYTKQKLDFKINTNNKNTYILNTVPYKIIDYDFKLNKIKIFPKKNKYF